MDSSEICLVLRQRFPQPISFLFNNHTGSQADKYQKSLMGLVTHVTVAKSTWFPNKPRYFSNDLTGAEVTSKAFLPWYTINRLFEQTTPLMLPSSLYGFYTRITPDLFAQWVISSSRMLHRHCDTVRITVQHAWQLSPPSDTAATHGAHLAPYSIEY